jgi:hypothetical protein
MVDNSFVSVSRTAVSFLEERVNQSLGLIGSAVSLAFQTSRGS